MNPHFKSFISPIVSFEGKYYVNLISELLLKSIRTRLIQGWAFNTSDRVLNKLLYLLSNSTSYLIIKK